MARNQVSVPLNYRGHELLKDFRIDILVEEAIILEIKSSESLLAVHEAQIISCLKLSNKKILCNNAYFNSYLTTIDRMFEKT